LKIAFDENQALPFGGKILAKYI